MTTGAAPWVRTGVRIEGLDAVVAAWVYRPAGTGVRQPCVVMGHGFSGIRDDAGLAGYAEAFAGAGLVVVLFDYRHFGSSGGTPRQLLDIGRQQEDWRAVVTWARRQPFVDADRLAVWGTSFGGGHVQQLAAGDPGIAAAVAQNPFCNADGGQDGPWHTARLAGAALRDAVQARLGLAPHYIGVVGHPGDLAVMTSEGALGDDLGSLPREDLWQNRVAARVLLATLRWRPGDLAPRIRCPIRYDVAEADVVTPAAPAVAAAGLAPHGELVRWPLTHFEFYRPPWRGPIAAGQAAFLARALGVVPEPAAAAGALGAAR